MFFTSHHAKALVSVLTPGYTKNIRVVGTIMKSYRCVYIVYLVRLLHGYATVMTVAVIKFLLTYIPSVVY